MKSECYKTLISTIESTISLGKQIIKKINVHLHIVFKRKRRNKFSLKKGFTELLSSLKCFEIDHHRTIYCRTFYNRSLVAYI